MSALDYIIIALVAAAAVFAATRAWRNRGKCCGGGSCGDCAACGNRAACDKCARQGGGKNQR